MDQERKFGGNVKIVSIVMKQHQIIELIIAPVVQHVQAQLLQIKIDYQYCIQA